MADDDKNQKDAQEERKDSPKTEEKASAEPEQVEGVANQDAQETPEETEKNGDLSSEDDKKGDQEGSTQDADKESLQQDAASVEESKPAKKTREDKLKEKREARLKRKEERRFEKEALPTFNVGDSVRVYYEVVRGNTKRLQPFEGIVIAQKGRGDSKTFTVRRIAAGGIGVERIWPMHSPLIKRIEVKRKGYVRRAKLYYLRDRVGRAASRVREQR